jgi:potassium efflux system protein
MIEMVRQFLFTEIIKFETYGINVLNIILIVPILFVDFSFFRIINRFLKKRGLLQKSFVKTIMRVFKWALHFLAFIGIMKVLGVKLENLFDFVRAVLNFKLITIKDTQISLLTIIVMIVVIWVSTKIAKLAKNYFNKKVFPRFKLEEGLRFSLSKFIGYLIIALGIVIALQGLGIRLSALTVFAGVLGVGIGFGMQSITANIVSGIVILFERPIKEGDVVRLSHTVGKVLKISLRASVIRTIYNEHLIVPNSDFINAVVENMSYGDLKLRISVNVGVAYGTDPNLVQETLIAAAYKTPNIMKDPEPTVFFRDFGNSSLDFEILAWIAVPEERFATESALRFSIVEQFKEKEITIPFPQRDVYIKSMPH